ncbi:hypothetical protein D3C77_374740 [compost metagenome]
MLGLFGIEDVVFGFALVVILVFVLGQLIHLALHVTDTGGQGVDCLEDGVEGCGVAGLGFLLGFLFVLLVLGLGFLQGLFKCGFVLRLEGSADSINPGAFLRLRVCCSHFVRISNCTSRAAAATLYQGYVVTHDVCLAAATDCQLFVFGVVSARHLTQAVPDVLDGCRVGDQQISEHQVALDAITAADVLSDAHAQLAPIRRVHEVIGMCQGDRLAFKTGDGLGAEHFIGVTLDGDQAARSTFNERAVLVHQLAFVVEQRAGTGDRHCLAQQEPFRGHALAGAQTLRRKPAPGLVLGSCFHGVVTQE